MNKLVAYLNPLWVWVLAWWLILNGAAYTVVSALAGDNLKGLGEQLMHHWQQWKGLFTWL